MTPWFYLSRVGWGGVCLCSGSQAQVPWKMGVCVSVEESGGTNTWVYSPPSHGYANNGSCSKIRVFVKEINARAASRARQYKIILLGKTCGRKLVFWREEHSGA